jgi:hypothetical protein
MTQEERIAIFGMGVLHRLVSDGALGGGDNMPTPYALAEFDQLEASGWRMTGEEAKAMVEIMAQDGIIRDDEETKQLLGMTMWNWDEAKRWLEENAGETSPEPGGAQTDPGKTPG